MFDPVRTLAIGIDLVHIPSFADQVNAPGTTFVERTFSARELRQVRARIVSEQDSLAPHLAARWAGKEAVVKAWSSALLGHPPVLSVDDFDWRSIEILNDRWGRPYVQLGSSLNDSVLSSLVEAHVIDSDTAQLRWPLSLTHEVDYASAQVLLVSDR